MGFKGEIFEKLHQSQTICLENFKMPHFVHVYHLAKWYQVSVVWSMFTLHIGAQMMGFCPGLKINSAGTVRGQDLCSVVWIIIGCKEQNDTFAIFGIMLGYGLSTFVKCYKIWSVVVLWWTKGQQRFFDLHGYSILLTLTGKARFLQTITSWLENTQCVSGRPKFGQTPELTTYQHNQLWR